MNPKIIQDPTITNPAELILRLDLNSIPEPNTGCVLWLGAVTPFGHGLINIQRKNRIVSRISWIAHNGPIPAGKLVCHKCDVPSCINPNHLFLASHRENMEDMDKKGRRPFFP